MRTAIRAIFWDNDGILVDTERLYFQANAEILALEGITVTEELFRRHWLYDSQGILAVGKDRSWSDQKVSELRRIRDERYSALLGAGQLLLPNVAEVLAGIPREIIQAIVTSSKKDHFAIIHANSGLLQHIQFVVAEGDYARSKPAPDPYLKAIERAAVKPEECVVVEDSERGLRAAKAAGLRCWVIPTDLSRNGDFSAADRVLNDISEIPAALSAIGGL